MKLLNIDANPKTVKGQKRGFMTAVLYLAPHKASGRNVCPMADLAGCVAGCLNTAGRGGIARESATITTPSGSVPDNAIQRCRIRRTEYYHSDRAGFLAQLVKEIEAFQRKATRKGLTPAVRLNGTSDIQWERGHYVEREGQLFPSIMEAFPDLTFYDYTKIPQRQLRGMLPANYDLTLSYSGADTGYAAQCRDAGHKGTRIALVVRSKALKALILRLNPKAVDGDAHDLRFTEKTGALVLLTAKGRARKDASGFVYG